MMRGTRFLKKAGSPHLSGKNFKSGEWQDVCSSSSLTLFQLGLSSYVRSPA